MLKLRGRLNNCSFCVEVDCAAFKRYGKDNRFDAGLKSNLKGSEDLKKVKTETHPNEIETHQDVRRISCKVSPEVKTMWDEIVATDKLTSKDKKRYYPARTLERLIRADYQIMKAWRR